MKKKQLFRARLSELPALGDFILSSFLNDKDLFTNLSPTYGDDFVARFNSTLQAVKDASTPLILTTERSNATRKLHTAQDKLISMTEHLDWYCQKAGKRLSIFIDDLELVKLRKNLRARNCEASILGAKKMYQMLKPSIPILEEQGFSADRFEEIDSLIRTIESLNVESNRLLNERKRLVEKNLDLFNACWGMIKDIMQAGQLIHRNNPVRKDEYVEKKLMTRVRVMKAPMKAAEKQRTGENANKEQAVKG